jgi:hypothetical protein
VYVLSIIISPTVIAEDDVTISKLQSLVVVLSKIMTSDAPGLPLGFQHAAVVAKLVPPSPCH